MEENSNEGKLRLLSLTAEISDMIDSIDNLPPVMEAGTLDQERHLKVRYHLLICLSLLLSELNMKWV